MLGREHRVVLVNRSYVYSYAPSFTWVMLGRRTGRRISRDLRTLSKKGIEFEQGEVQGIDPANKRVLVGERELTYDYLVVALGAQYSADEIEGLGRTWTYYHLEGAEGLQEQLPRFQAGRVAIVVSGLPYKCPPAPYEGALLLDDYFRRRRIRDDIEISVFTPESRPLMAAGEQVGGRIIEMLSQRSIDFHANARLTAVHHESNVLHFDDGHQAPFDMTIATPLHRVPDILVQSGMAATGGWVPVDRETLATNFEDVYAIGDCTAIPLGDGLALPKAGVIAHGEAEVVTRNISAEINEGRPIWAYGGQGACFLETGGNRGTYVSGHFFAEPAPEVTMRQPSRIWHWAKVGFERLWLWRWF